MGCAVSVGLSLTKQLLDRTPTQEVPLGEWMLVSEPGDLCACLSPPDADGANTASSPPLKGPQRHLCPAFLHLLN